MHNGLMEDQPQVQNPHPVVGREAELDLVSAFVSGRSQNASLVLAGEAGIGKTTLWQAGNEAAASNGLRVLSTRASEGEAGLLFAGLADLVDNMDAKVLERVPAPQMHAVEVAIRRIAAGTEPPDRFAISAGFLAAVRESAAAEPSLIAIDDVQWLDTSSAECLIFLSRRLGDEKLRFLFSRRGDEPSMLERTLEPRGLELVEVKAMSLGAIGRLISDRLGLLLPRRVIRQLHETSHGNPLLGMEIARMIRSAGVPDVGGDLPMPTMVDEAFGARVRELPESLGRALLAVSLSAALGRNELASVVDQIAIQDALDAGLFTLDRGRILPSHPLLSAAARRQSTTAQRRDLHHLLAEAVSEPVLAARHRALATFDRDSEVAATVAAAARSALDQGAFHEAEELAAHALRLTPDGAPEMAERVLDLARKHESAGEFSAAASLLEDRIRDLPAGRPRVLARVLWATTASDHEVRRREIDLAIAESEHDDDLEDLRAIALATKAIDLSIGEVRQLAHAAELAVVALEISEGTQEEAFSRTALAWANVLMGVPAEHLREEIAASVPGRAFYLTTVDRPLGVALAFRGNLDGARQVLSRLFDLADERGEPQGRLGLGRQLCEIALRAGDVHEAVGLLDGLDQWNAEFEMRAAFTRLQALASAIRGSSVQATSLARTVLDEAWIPTAPEWDRLEATRALGLAALFDGAHEVAAGRFEAVWEHCRREGVEDPGAFPVAGDLVEALAESGRVDRARQVVEILERLSHQQRHPWAMATTIRSRAMIAMTEGDFEQAGRDLGQAASDYGRLGLDFEQARCLVHLGRLCRRNKKRADARQALESAIAHFERLGCEGWADQAKLELSRVSGRRATGTAELTPSERRVAEMAAAGHSNKEIAQALFVGVYTVEAHLSSAYAKLGIRSRSQLAGRIAAG
jgi:DNA-binding CsgD family transcriptional regulator